MATNKHRTAKGTKGKGHRRRKRSALTLVPPPPSDDNRTTSWLILTKWVLEEREQLMFQHQRALCDRNARESGRLANRLEWLEQQIHRHATQRLDYGALADLDGIRTDYNDTGERLDAARVAVRDLGIYLKIVASRPAALSVDRGLKEHKARLLAGERMALGSVMGAILTTPDGNMHNLEAAAQHLARGDDGELSYHVLLKRVQDALEKAAKAARRARADNDKPSAMARRCVAALTGLSERRLR